jgi:hypothetical protein
VEYWRLADGETGYLSETRLEEKSLCNCDQMEDSRIGKAGGIVKVNGIVMIGGILEVGRM